MIQAFKSWIEKSGGSWTVEALDDDTAYCDMSKGKSLEEVREFKKSSPDLPWLSSVPIVETDA